MVRVEGPRDKINSLLPTRRKKEITSKRVRNEKRVRKKKLTTIEDNLQTTELKFGLDKQY